MSDVEIGWIIAGSLAAFVAVMIVRYGRAPNVQFIENPNLGMLDLTDGPGRSLMAADREVLGSLFHAVLEGTDKPPKCDVLFLYCTINVDGSIVGSAVGLLDVIRDSGALIVILASENVADRFGEVAKPSGHGHANLVFTMDRRGMVFGEFFYKLFGLMKDGTPILSAWVKLVPQIPGKDHLDCPVTLLVSGAGPVAFR